MRKNPFCKRFFICYASTFSLRFHYVFTKYLLFNLLYEGLKFEKMSHEDANFENDNALQKLFELIVSQIAL